MSNITHKILVVGPTGSGKTTQIWTLPGKKFVYAFDPNAMASLVGCPGLDIDKDVMPILPEMSEMDGALKGFNKGARDDKPFNSRVEPTSYARFITHLSAKMEEDGFKDYDWICFDSMTFLAQLLMDRQLFLNKRYGKIEDMGDYRCVGSKMSDVFRVIASRDKNMYFTGHIDEFQDEKTKKIATLLALPGKAKKMLPLMMSSIFHMYPAGESANKAKFEIQTIPAQRGLQTIRTSIKGLKPTEDVTISDWEHPEGQGIGRFLNIKH